jgi:hypothetical protein
MWRREKGLKYWLDGLSDSPGIRQRLSRWLEFSDTVREGVLSLVTSIHQPGDELQLSAQVIDGLENLGEVPSSSTPAEPGAIEDRKATIRAVELFNGATTRTLQVPADRVRLRQTAPAVSCHTRALKMFVESAAVHKFETILFLLPLVNESVAWFLPNPAISVQTAHISRLPQARGSVEIGALKRSEREELLREAETQKGIAPGESELIALFRNVPVEMISRLHFLAEKKMIYFSISQEPIRTRTRVYDMAAVRNISSREIHLISSRTHYRSVVLN